MTEYSSVFERLPSTFTRTECVWSRNVGDSWECFQDFSGDYSYINPRFAIHGNKVIFTGDRVLFYLYDKYVGAVEL